MLTPTARDGHWPIGRTGVDLGPFPRAPAHRSRFALLLTVPNLALGLERISFRGLLLAGRASPRASGVRPRSRHCSRRWRRLDRRQRGGGLNRSTRTSFRRQAGVVFFLAKPAVWILVASSRGRVASKLRCDREQTAHLQTVLLHLSVRTQIRTAQPGSIRATWLGTIAAAYGLSSSPAAGLTCQMHLREHVLGGGNGLGCGVDRLSWFAAVLRPRRWPGCAVPLRPFARQTAWPAA